MSKLRQFVAVGGFLFTTVGVPATAFIIRMVRGDTNNANEDIISEWLTTFLDKFRQENK